MRRSRFSEEQIVGILNEHEPSAELALLCRQYGVGQQTIYRWRQKDSGLERGEARRLKAREEENVRVERLVAEATLDVEALEEFSDCRLR